MKFIATSIFSVILFSSITFSQGKVQKFNPFSGTIVFSVEGGFTFANTDYSGLGVDYLGRASLEYFLPASVQSGFGFRLFGGAGFINGDDTGMDPQSFRTNISTFGGGVVFILSIEDKYFPYLFAGISTLSFNPRGEGGEQLPNNAAGKYSNNEANYHLELGVRYPVTPNLSLTINSGIQISPNDWLDDKAIGTNNDLLFTVLAGISYSFLTEFDSDEDGVIDADDACSNTPSGIRVDEFGCPVDTDNDEVPDYLDNCSGTPKNVKVDEFGCPIDTDNDGVPDYTDICPNSAIGISVDELGCPYDLDTDGVPDYLDRCPDTPYNIEVDNRGCPIDSDLDGVPDYLDQCPGTLAGMQVDEKGCEITPKEPGPVIEELESLDVLILSAGTSFAFNSADLKPAAYPELEKILNEMKKYPMSRWKIEGYTDNIGSEEGNLRISKMRADAVANYFISRGIPKGRFIIEGLGSKNPIADNKTEEGREKNRRVAITRLN